ncbi:MAG: hypothetical protein WC683_04990 [bacterium]
MIDRHLIHTCTIQTRTAGSDAYNSATPSWATEVGSVPCLFVPVTKRSYSTEQGEVVTCELLCFFRGTQILTEHSRRITTTQAGFSGTYDILAVVPASAVGSKVIHHYEVALQKVVV